MFDYRWHNNLYHGFKRRDNCVIQSRVPRQRQPSVNRAGNTHHSSLRFFLLRWLRHIQLCLSYNNFVMVKGIKLNLKTKDLFSKYNVRLLFLSDEKNPPFKTYVNEIFVFSIALNTAPVIQNLPQTLFISEHLSVASLIYQISVYDPDVTDVLSTTFTVQPSSGALLFETNTTGIQCRPPKINTTKNAL